MIPMKKVKILSFFICILFSTFYTHSQIISTLAGGGIGDGSIATNIAISSYSSAVDKMGNVYISDNDNNCIRKVNISDGRILTIAGTFEKGYSGDGDYAIKAKLNRPMGICLDKQGNIVFADAGNHRIRKISISTGKITSIAGTGQSGYNGDNIEALNANIYSPFGICFDKDGNLYIADTGNKRIRKVNFLTNIVNTIAGGNNANTYSDSANAENTIISAPSGVCVDNIGNVYFAEYGINIIRKINPTNNMITIFAGDYYRKYDRDSDNVIATTTSLFSPFGICVDSKNNIYIADSDNRRIRKINFLTNIITSVAGIGIWNRASSLPDGNPAIYANLERPTGITLDSMDNLYITDYWDNRIRKVDKLTGNINSIAGGGKIGFAGDGGLGKNATLSNPLGICIDDKGNLYFTDKFNNSIRKINIYNDTISTIAGEGGQVINSKLNDPQSVNIDTKGDLYFCSVSVANKIDMKKGLMTTIAGNGTTGFYGDGDLAINAELYAPFNIAVDKSQNIYICDYNSIRKIDFKTEIINSIVGKLDSGFTGDGGLAIDAKLYGAGGIVFDNFGNLYVADIGNNRIRKVYSSTGIINTIAGNGEAGYSGDGGLAINASLNHPSDICIDKLGNIYFVDKNNQCVRKIDHIDGTITTIAGNGIKGFSGDNGLATLASLSNPSGVCVDSIGNIYISDYDNRRIRKVTSKFPLAIENLKSSNDQLKLYPNPSTGLLNIDFNHIVENLSLSIIDIFGNVLMDFDYKKAGSVKLNLESLKEGLYFLNINSKESSSIHKLLKY